MEFSTSASSFFVDYVIARRVLVLSAEAIASEPETASAKEKSASQ
jgi:hypothetical protein